uniref:Sec-independent translocase component C n=1 Tax=Sciadococcus taiwanensis TaxID=3028030 RepID=A0A9Y1MWT0_9RHOD|nr:Sec-independent translocase component C [Sciadococcus taiwanensis]
MLLKMSDNKIPEQEFIDEKRMSLSEHIEELRERSIQSLLVFLGALILCLINIKSLVRILQLPAKGVKFLQLAPGEYFFTSVKIALYFAFTLSSPFLIYQIIIFIIPGLTRKERNILLPTIIISSLLFFTGILFGYLFIIPTALKFFLKYGADIIEPFWSFEEYFNFILLSLISTGLVFQIPILQISLGIFKIFSSQRMFSLWRYIITLATIAAAILTPSTDPLTQIILASTILFLYFGGILVLKFIGI